MCSPLDYYGWVTSGHLKNLELFYHGKEKICEKDDHCLYRHESLSCRELLVTFTLKLLKVKLQMCVAYVYFYWCNEDDIFFFFFDM